MVRETGSSSCCVPEYLVARHGMHSSASQCVRIGRTCEDEGCWVFGTAAMRIILPWQAWVRKA